MTCLGRMLRVEEIGRRGFVAIHQEEHVPGGQVMVMVDGMPQVKVSKQELE